MTQPGPESHKRGDVVLVLFPHSDLRMAKTRPVLTVGADNLATDLSRVIVAMVSGKAFRAGYPSCVTVSLPSIRESCGRQSADVSPILKLQPFDILEVRVTRDEYQFVLYGGGGDPDIVLRDRTSLAAQAVFDLTVSTRRRLFTKQDVGDSGEVLQSLEILFCPGRAQSPKVELAEHDHRDEQRLCRDLCEPRRNRLFLSEGGDHDVGVEKVALIRVPLIGGYHSSSSTFSQPSPMLRLISTRSATGITPANARREPP